jgi:hypothetical protein
MPHIADRAAVARARLWSVPALDADVEVPRAAPPIDDHSTAIDELAFVLATDHLSTLEKIWLLEQWRYDMFLLDMAAGEGFGTPSDDGVLLQQVNKALLQLTRHCARH